MSRNVLYLPSLRPSFRAQSSITLPRYRFRIRPSKYLFNVGDKNELGSAWYEYIARLGYSIPIFYFLFITKLHSYMEVSFRGNH